MIVGLLGRHAENPENETNDLRGRIDLPLDEEGQKQAQEQSDFIISRYAVERIVSSPLLRAMQTAEPTAKAFRLLIIQEGALMSTDMGLLTGEDKDEYAEIYQMFLETPDLKMPRGESFDDLYQRVGDFMEEDLKNGAFTFYEAHSSTGVVLENLFNGDRELKPGIDHLTDTGGVCEIHWDGRSYELKPVFRESKKKKETPQHV